MISEIIKRFTYHKVVGSAVDDMQVIRTTARGLALLFHETVPPGREANTALSKLEEAVMWANAGIARTKGEPQ